MTKIITETNVVQLIWQSERVPDRPCDIPGIPEKYTAWRPHQKQTIEWTIGKMEQGINFVCWDAPTGYGKSLSAICISKLAGLKTMYCVSTRQLQEQLQNDFPEAVVIWGREHYLCVRFPSTELTAADCTHRKHSPCPKLNECLYRTQKHKALASDLVIVNYSFFLNEANGPGDFSGWPLIIFDEADLAENELMKHTSVTLTGHQLEKCQIKPPERKTRVEAWLKWAQDTITKVENELHKFEDKLKLFLKTGEEPPKAFMWELIHYQRLHAKLKILIELVDDTWVAELNDPQKWQFKPTRVQRFGHLLTGHGQKILSMSATMLDAQDWAWNLGIEDKVVFRQIPNIFPKEHRPIIFLPTAEFSQKSMNDESLILMVRVIDGLLDKHKGEKGLVHTVSYQIAKYLLEHSYHQNRLIGHNAGTRTEALQQLIQSEAPLVLVSPSFSRGVDLFGDRASFQICVKLPFPDLGDKQTAKRRWSGKDGERWYLLETVRAIVQMAGRIIRSPNDKKPTYILDERWPRFYHQMEKDFPLWFREACEW